MQTKIIKTEPVIKNGSDIHVLINKKKLFFLDVVQKTILYVQRNKMLDILGISDVNNCMNTLFALNKTLKEITNNTDITTENEINVLQTVNNDLSTLLKSVGTESFEDLLFICLGNNSVSTYASNETDKHKFELLKKYFHPTSYKLFFSKKVDNDKSVKEEHFFTDKSNNLDCAQVSIHTKSFHLKVYGMQVIVHNPIQNKSLIITGIVDDMLLDFLNNKFITEQLSCFVTNIPKEEEFKTEYFNRFMTYLTLKDVLIHNTSDIYSKYIGIISNLNTIQIKSMNQIVKEFMTNDLYLKRNTIIQLLICSDKNENQYLAYLLYDLLSNEVNGTIDTQEQTILFDSFPWFVKQYFRDAMKKTIQYTNELLHFDIQKIPIEQQICLLKVNDNVKEKAMQKLKEVKSKSEDSGSKARQYLDGLLKIPFGVYRTEPILYSMNKLKSQFINIVNEQKISYIPLKETYTSIEMLSYIKLIKNDILLTTDYVNIIKQSLLSNKAEQVTIIEKINYHITAKQLQMEPIIVSNKKKTYIKNKITEFIELVKTEDIILFDFLTYNEKHKLIKEISLLEKQYKQINTYMKEVNNTLDLAVHGHKHAKNQISRIIGQWINGQQDGYCFGFEGSPGVGKTSLAKRGLSDCLKDENGVSRPFAMIQIGGDSNGSSLHGHNYTYVGSTWGSIVQILMDKKCMNPIIFIDEIDKISKTENGKEIIGILTHLLDQTQNDSFQDKYFNGIDLDLSKALFILSYNDVDAIDRILLDRIHRIKFKNLSLEDKLVICNSHILPEIYKKMGLAEMITIPSDVLTMLIEEYTLEPGVRKLKEILFEIVAEINLDILNNFDNTYTFPIVISCEDIKKKYFKEKHEIVIKKIHAEPKVGVINGLWANALGQGGIIPIQTNFYPAEYFLQLKLTGMQGDVMKESMNVALTLAWNLTSKEKQQYLIEQKNHGLHVHCPEGSVPKDGPSAGTAITITMYSLFNRVKIKNNVAITGEITLDGQITEIGGLDVKILGGIKAGVTVFIYPKSNQKDFLQFMEKYKDSELVKNIQFQPVEKIQDVFSFVFE